MSETHPPLSNVADDPLPDLVRGLKSLTVAERLRAAKDLARLGWLAREALPVLITALEDDDAKVREVAAQAIGNMGPDALPTLAGMLTHLTNTFDATRSGPRASSAHLRARH